MRATGNNIVLHDADELVVHRSQDPRVVIIEYDVHGKIVATGSSYDNRFISVVTIEGRKIVQWRDNMDSVATMSARSQVSSLPSGTCSYGTNKSRQGGLQSTSRLSY